ncbi:N-terminal asparagine amidohydrolase-domain-containing protein [Tribonema minus]|uniref:N-terminal asparagine amidohydrolase-domain-containing protein n=1 Tax=Tribonema minus TaxID=303371 RepID=A0A836C992_9STRA|nr:N-terminal asparagine amidohydrolase-domain-containing protein [Tribonema minus]
MAAAEDCLPEVEACQVLRNKSIAFSDSPDVVLQGAEGRSTLHVIQREFAVIHSASGDATPGVPHSVGSDAATTCHIVALRHSSSGTTVLGHLDSAERSQLHVDQMLQALPSSSPSVDVYIVGGLRTGDGQGAAATQALLRSLHAHPVQMRLVLACIGALNTCWPGVAAAEPGAAPTPSAPDGRHTVIPAQIGASLPNATSAPQQHWYLQLPSLRPKKLLHSVPPLPVKCGLSVNASTGHAQPVRFDRSARGPAFVIRSARVLSSATALAELYDARIAAVRVAPFPLPMRVRDARCLLALGSARLLQVMSTSPAAEDDRFVPDMREALQAVVKWGSAWEERVFPQGQPIVVPACGSEREGDSEDKAM